MHDLTSAFIKAAYIKATVFPRVLSTIPSGPLQVVLESPAADLICIKVVWFGNHRGIKVTWVYSPFYNELPIGLAVPVCSQEQLLTSPSHGPFMTVDYIFSHFPSDLDVAKGQFS